MSIRLLVNFVPVLFLTGFLVACSSSDELSGGEQQKQDESGSFQRIDQEEPIIPETDEPVTLEPVEDEDLPVTEKPVPVKPADVPATTPSTPPARQEPAQDRSVQTPPATVPAASQEPPRAGTMMWSVQVGAFKSEAGAFQLIEELKKKFNQPLYKRYDPVTGYYKVTLGSFPTREQATEYKLEVQSRGYPDVFTVEVAR
ncbi:MAG: SPOR domain-containing protein [Bacteroidota bacterium]|jgi:cell division septation protein DedD|nr:SPOR domain-containing protein [Bacteroidota bacterium]